MERPAGTPLSERQRELEETLSAFKTSQDRLGWVTRRGREGPPLDAESKTDERLVPGCLAKTWLVADFADGRCWFRADSESAIIRGVARLLCDFYSGQPAEEILSHGPEFLRRFGIDQHLTPNRRNSLSRLYQEMQLRGCAARGGGLI